MNKKNFWFTLIEIIVVVTIILILSSIWAVSYTKLLKTSKDTANYSLLKEISSWLNSYEITNKTLPLPENYNKILAWTSNIDSYQWTFWKQAMDKILLSSKVDEYPLYRLTKNLKAFDLFYKTKQRKKDNLIVWDNIWIILNNWQNITTDVDLLAQNTTNLSINFHSWEILNWQNDSAFSKFTLSKWVYNSSCYSLFKHFWYTQNWLYKINSAWNIVEKYCPMAYFYDEKVFSYFSFDNWELYDEVWNYNLSSQNYINRSPNSWLFRNTWDTSTGSFANLSVDAKVYDNWETKSRNNFFDESTVCFWSNSNFSSSQKWLEISFYETKSYTWKVIDFSHRLTNSWLQEFWKIFYDYTSDNSPSDPKEPSGSVVSTPSDMNFYCWTFSKSYIKAYLNWEEIFSKVVNSAFKNSDKILWNITFFDFPSSLSWTSQYEFDELIILKKALSEAEIKTFYINQK